ncbi:glycoside hydrolase family 3 N-terminal domain-containing protein [Kutzneria kofuensis]|uniref:Beta-glucosidase n=1 Tax=Kutzneria kofuensis TaxID=103725 RepID=A0A7W9KLK5_9PSEU|nr:glycoside hydrolase family 3 N-terminal domain-containing protein [Kutzneria kofuensis]MBB5894823.1 beta-glucosidase [Kutzneria kofuensis]
MRPAVEPPDRVRDLLARMTVAEKIAQLQGIWVGVDEAGAVAPHQHDMAVEPVDFDAAVRHGIGQLTRAFGTRPVDPALGARAVARSQRKIMAANRFGIPAMVHEECLTGLTAWQATIFPSPLCWGATFDPDIIERVGAAIGGTMRSLGVHQGLAPVLDVVRDLRWGRVEETIGEDPFLVGTVGSAYVRGLESAGVVATLKHFVGYSSSRAGRNFGPVSIGSRELADVLLPPFEMALRAGARSVMNAYTDNDGIPVAADESLLTGRLRESYGFTGTVVADYFAVSFLQTLHGVVDTPAEAAGLALRAGIDVELPTVNCYGAPLLAAVDAGEVDLELIDRAVSRVLTQKWQLGLLDDDYSPEPVGPVDLDPQSSRTLALDLARQSIVLLHNKDTLPLAPGSRIAVVGPRADDPHAVMGCYSFPVHVGAHHPDVPLGISVPTVLDALRRDYDVTYALGCPVLGGDDADIAEAVEVARDADCCVVVLGDRTGMFGAGTSGEGCDVADLRLPGRQEELLEAVLGTGKPVVLVLLVGRPYEISRQVDRLAAIVCGFLPGEEGSTALADVLSGRVDPSGRLPVSFPRAGAGQPSTYLAPTLGRLTEVSSVDPTPLFPFGHGLSYAPVTWLDAECPPEWPTDGVCRLSVTLHNGNDVPATEVVQVYLHDPVAEVVRPVQQLIAYSRVTLPPGGTTRVDFTLHADLTCYTGLSGRRQVDPGAVELRIGRSSADISSTLSVNLTGSRRYVGFDRVLRPTQVAMPTA